MSLDRVIKPKVLGIITARGGSKGLLGKNILPILGKPLIAYTIDAALRSEMITKIIVSSDDDEILDVSRSFGVEIIKRPSELAQDTSKSEEAILHAIESLQNDGEFFDIVILLQPTSPLRTSKDIDNSIRSMLSKNAEAVISVTNIGKKPFKSYYRNKYGFLKGLHNDESPNMRRQDLPDAFLANGAIYAIFTEVFLKTNSLLPTTTIPYEMSEEKSCDIDNIIDLKLVEKIIKKKLDENS
jgi:CMP-N,N'-diacetyllegionaminic acid synthase